MNRGLGSVKTVLGQQMAHKREPATFQIDLSRSSQFASTIFRRYPGPPGRLLESEAMIIPN